jgi:serine/threonine protein kinase
MKQMSAQDSIVQLIEVYDMVDWKVPSGMLFLVLELLEGVDLEQWVQKGGSPLRPFEAREILTQVGAALRAMHQCDMIHRDVKPSNVFLSNAPDGSLRATLLDFGLAKKAIFDADGSGGLSGDLSLSLGSSKRSGGGEFRKPKLSKVDQSRRLVRRGSLVGTRNFAAPEVVDCSQSTGSYDMTVDAFSLGRTIRFALTGTVNAGSVICAIGQFFVVVVSSVLHSLTS